jgi:ankyrin repeat protein
LGADVNALGRDYDYYSYYGTALSAAVVASDENPVVNILLEAGADVNLMAGTYGAPLIAACLLNHPTCVEKLLEHGADPNIKFNGVQTAMERAAWIAGDSDDDTILMNLLKHGGDINLFFEVTVEIDGCWNVTPLQAVCEAGNVRMVRKLVTEYGARLTVDRKLQGKMIIRSCFARACMTGKLDVAKALLELGANVNEWAGHYGHVIQAVIER